jgi:hypothetical protein
MNARYFGRDPLKLDALAALLRIGCKYDISGLRQEAFSRFCITFPSSLEAWSDAEKNAHPPSGIIKKDTIAFFFHAANLAYEYQIHLALPALLLKCAVEDYSDLVDFSEEEASGGDIVRLLPSLLSKVIKGKEALTRARNNLCFPWLLSSYKSPADCLSPKACCAHRAKVAREHAEEDVNLREFGPEHWDDSWTLQLCSDCSAEAKNLYLDGSDQLWEQLPVLFKLGTWQSLKTRMR